MASRGKESAKNQVRCVVIEPIIRSALTSGLEPDWRPREFPTARGAQTWMGQRVKEHVSELDVSKREASFRVTNRGIGFTILLEVVQRGSRPGERSIRDFIPECGVPEPVLPDQAEREWGDFLQHGPSFLDGTVWLGPTWTFDKIAGEVSNRPRRESAFEQVKFELAYLEKSFEAVFGAFPPANFWVSHQLRLSLLIAARMHISPEHSVRSMRDLCQLNLTAGLDHDLLAWNAFRWAVKAASLFAESASQPKADPRFKLLADWIEFWRGECGWRVEDFASRTGVSVRQIERYRAGKSLPPPSKIIDFRKAFEKETKIAVPHPFHPLWTRPEIETGD